MIRECIRKRTCYIGYTAEWVRYAYSPSPVPNIPVSSPTKIHESKLTFDLTEVITMYFLVYPKTMLADRADFGDWTALTDANGYVNFDTVEEARERGEASGKPYFVLSLVG